MAISRPHPPASRHIPTTTILTPKTTGCDDGIRRKLTPVIKELSNNLIILPVRLACSLHWRRGSQSVKMHP
jgi:hypothetical protein